MFARSYRPSTPSSRLYWRNAGSSFGLKLPNRTLLLSEMNPASFRKVIQLLATNSTDWLVRNRRPEITVNLRGLDSECEIVFHDNGPGIRKEIASTVFALDAAISAFAEHVGLGVPLRATLHPSLWVYGVDAALAPIGFAIAWVAVDHPGAVLLELPLMGLLWLFARERSWRIDQALELSSAYRGTALLLGDVVEFDHEYTGSHSRDVVELSVAVGERLRLTAAQLRNLEFAALLHDVGKIARPEGDHQQAGAAGPRGVGDHAPPHDRGAADARLRRRRPRERRA